MNQRDWLKKGKDSLSWGRGAHRSGRLEEASSAYHEALAAFEQATFDRGALAALNALGSLAQQMGDARAAEAHFADALSKAAGTPPDEALIHSNLASLHILNGGYDLAERHAKAALDIYTRLAQPRGCAMQLNTLARVATLRGQPQIATTLLTEACRCFEDAGDGAGLGRSLISLGAAHEATGALSDAKAAFERAGALLSSAGDARNTAHAVRGLGLIEMRGGDLVAAGEKLASALELFSQIGDGRGEICAWHDLGQLAAKGGDLPHALRNYDQSLELAAGHRVSEELARAQASRAQVLCELGELEAASHAANEALAYFSDLGHVGGQVGGRIHRARLRFYRGALNEAQADLDVALQLVREAGLRPLEATATIQRAKLMELKGDSASQRALLSEAVALYEAIGAHTELAEARLLILELDAYATGVPDLAAVMAHPHLNAARALYEAGPDRAGLMGLRGLTAQLYRCHGAYADAEALLRLQGDWLKSTGRRLAWLSCMGSIHLVRLRSGERPRASLIEGLGNESYTLGAHLQGIGLGFLAAEAHAARGHPKRARRSLRRWTLMLEAAPAHIPSLEARMKDAHARIALAEGDSAAAQRLAQEALALHRHLEDEVSARELREALP